MTNERDKTRASSASENSVTGDNTHFIQSAYATLRFMGINPQYIQTSLVSDTDPGSQLLFGIPETRVGVTLTGANYQPFVERGWTVVALNVEQLRVFHRIFQSFESLAMADKEAREMMRHREPAQQQDIGVQTDDMEEIDDLLDDGDTDDDLDDLFDGIMD